MAEDPRSYDSENESPVPPPDEEDAPIIEDAYQPADPADNVPEEDALELLSGLTRNLEEDPEALDEIDQDTLEASQAAAARVAERDDDSDTDAIPDDAAKSAEERLADAKRDWATELSAHRVAVELKRIETEVRRLLEGADDRRKRKLSGSRRWRELEEDLLSWQYTSRIDEQSLRTIRELIVRRDYLYTRLAFLSRTRPIWNS